MSFVRTLATLAAGYAAAKGIDQYRKMGGMAGLQDAMKNNEQLSQMSGQFGTMLERMGVPGGAAAFDNMVAQFNETTARASDSASAGLAGLMKTFGSATAAGSTQAAQMMDAMTGTTAATATLEENAKLMIRAMLQAAKADGEIDAEEQAKIMEHLGEISAEERAFVEAEMNAPVDPMALANDTSEAMRAQVYATAAMAIRVDTPSETAYLQNLASALGLDPATVARIHGQMGLPA
ncbi:putative membrane protein [Rhodovulum sp. P5]|uniref:tellurite resistance TerB family protein n=1 Tax=Rhodovulum sp. P5 TaxID=1564506 RepID=UPI0009C30AB3|nr:DUF533 domain-containing protein [Rhodovulum sp. P5]ARE39786.1 putative membrane protein [Rhodovulum sp. P5]